MSVNQSAMSGGIIVMIVCSNKNRLIEAILKSRYNLPFSKQTNKEKTKKKKKKKTTLNYPKYAATENF